MRLLLLLGVAIAANTSLAGNEKKGSVEQQRKAILQATNALRKAKGLPPLALNEKLTNAAQGHAENLAKQQRDGDDDKNPHILDGKNAADRVKAAGYEGKTVRENIAHLNATANAWQRAMTGWKKSPVHRRTMLATDVEEIGIGIAQTKAGSCYFCQVFSSAAQRRPSLQFDINNKTKDSVEVQFSWEKEGRTLKPSTFYTFECRIGTSAALRMTVLYRKPSKEKINVSIKEGYVYVISDKDGNGRYTIDQVEDESKDESR